MQPDDIACCTPGVKGHPLSAFARDLQQLEFSFEFRYKNKSCHKQRSR